MSLFSFINNSFINLNIFQNIDPKKMENLKILLNETNSLDFFETKLTEIKNIKEFDQEVIRDLSQKVSQGNFCYGC